MNRLFRFHLSTLVLMSLLSGGAMWLITKTTDHYDDLRMQGRPVPWKVLFFEPIENTVVFPNGIECEWYVLGIRIECQYDSETGICYKALAIDIVIWLVVLLIAGILIEWLTRRFSRKATSTKP